MGKALLAAVLLSGVSRAHFSLTDARKKLCQEPEKSCTKFLWSIFLSTLCITEKKNLVLFSKPCFLSQVTKYSPSGQK